MTENGTPMNSSNLINKSFFPVYSLSIHDLRVSGGTTTIRKLKDLLETFNIPITVHLIFDEELLEGSELFNFLLENCNQGRLEVVFHGLTHLCSRNVFRLFSFYHKYQAEYLDDSDDLRQKTGKMYLSSVSLLGKQIGICPPCWIAHKNNIQFFKLLKPIFIESLLSVSFTGKKYFSMVVSLGSSSKNELRFLRMLGNLMYLTAVLFQNSRVRVAIHDCDLSIPASMEFFKKKCKQLDKKGYLPVLMNELGRC